MTTKPVGFRHGFMVIFLGYTTHLYANDTAFGGSGSLPIPISQPDIQMVNERIIISGRKLNHAAMNGSWNYHCTFTFQNTRNEAVAITMGFPFPVNTGMSEVALPDKRQSSEGKALVYDFKVKIDNQPVTAKPQKIAANPDKGLYYEDAYLWDMTFSPLQTVTIQHDYETGATYDVMGFHWVSYVLKTGSLWQNNTIGHTTLEVIPNTPTRLCSEIDPKSDYLQPTPPGMTITGEGKTRKYSWNLSHFNPSDDLSLCLYTGKSYVRYQIILPYLQDEHALDKLRRLSPQQLRILRNTVFAQYGRVFTSPKLRQYFEKQWWYEANPNFDIRELNQEDRQLLALLNQV